MIYSFFKGSIPAWQAVSSDVDIEAVMNGSVTCVIAWLA
jgi:hypothetical protein